MSTKAEARQAAAGLSRAEGDRMCAGVLALLERLWAYQVAGGHARPDADDGLDPTPSTVGLPPEVLRARVPEWRP